VARRAGVTVAPGDALGVSTGTAPSTREPPPPKSVATVNWECAAVPQTHGSLSAELPTTPDRCFPSTPEPFPRGNGPALSRPTRLPSRRTAGSRTAKTARRTRTQTEGASRRRLGPWLTRALPPRRPAPALLPDALGTAVLARRNGGTAAFLAGCRPPAALAGSGSLVGGVAKRLAPHKGK